MEKTLTFIAICLMAGVAVFLWWKMGQIWKVSQLERADRIAEAFEVKKPEQPERLTPPEYVY